MRTAPRNGASSFSAAATLSCSCQAIGWSSSEQPPHVPKCRQRGVAFGSGGRSGRFGRRTGAEMLRAGVPRTCTRLRSRPRTVETPHSGAPPVPRSPSSEAPVRSSSLLADQQRPGHPWARLPAPGDARTGERRRGAGTARAAGLRTPVARSAGGAALVRRRRRIALIVSGRPGRAGGRWRRAMRRAAVRPSAARAVAAAKPWMSPPRCRSRACSSSCRCARSRRRCSWSRRRRRSQANMARRSSPPGTRMRGRASSRARRRTAPPWTICRKPACSSCSVPPVPWARDWRSGCTRAGRSSCCSPATPSDWRPLPDHSVHARRCCRPSTRPACARRCWPRAPASPPPASPTAWVRCC